MTRSTNLFDIDTITERTNILASGEIADSTSYHLSALIKVRPSFDYTTKGVVYIGEYDKDGVFIQRLSVTPSGGQIKTTKKTHFIRISYQYNSVLAGKGITQVNEGVEFQEFEEYYNRFKNGYKLDALNDVIDKANDRIMLDIPIDGVFETNETYADYTGFNSVQSDAVYSMFDDLVSQFPSYITKKFLGNDSIGNPISVYYFEPNFPEADLNTVKPTLFLTGGTHGYEHMGTLAIYLMMKQICEKWQDYQLLEALRFNVKFIIIPVVNPSGWNTYQRHNVNDVDINRNMPKGWTSGGTSGTSPLSELESQYVKQVLDENPDINMMYDFHNFHSGTSENFIWVPAPKPYLQHMAQNLISRMTRQWKKRYSFIPENKFIGYASTGSEGTIGALAREIYGIKYATTFEICNVWVLDQDTQPNDQKVCESGVEALVNWILINLREMSR